MSETAPRVGSAPPEAAAPPTRGGWAPLLGNLALRGATSSSRFVLVVATARLLSLGELGELGLVVAIVNLASIGLGLNYFQVTARKLLRGDAAASRGAVRDQAVVLLGAYLIGGIALGALTLASYVSARVAGWLAALTLVDHLGLEIQRLLVVRSRAVASNVVLFLRSGLWVFAAVATMWIWPGLRRIETIWWGWLIGGAMGIAYGVSQLVRMPWSEDLEPFEARTIANGLRSAIVLLAALLCLRAITSIDRLVLEAHVSRDVVGGYVFFAGIANTVFVLADSGVLSTRYADLVRSYQVGDWEQYERTTRAMVRGAAGLVAVLTGVTVVATPILLSWVGKAELTDGLSVLWVLLAATVTQVGALLLRNALYARGADLAILASCAAGCAAGAVVAWLATPRIGAMGAALSTAAGAVAMVAVSGGFLIARGARPGLRSRRAA